MKNKLEFVVLFSILMVLVLVGAGCGEGEEPPVPDEGNGVAPGAPTSDVVGEDISNVPRYPGSVRIYYGDVPGVADSTVVVYLTSASVDTVSSFYEEQLPANGWESSVNEEMMEEFGLTHRYVEQVVTKEGQQTIVLVGSSIDYPGYTEANITLTLE